MSPTVGFDFDHTAHGPVSEPFCIANFLREATGAESLTVNGRDAFQALPDDERKAIEDDCRLDDLFDASLRAFEIPALQVVLRDYHRVRFASIDEPSKRANTKQKRRKNAKDAKNAKEAGSSNPSRETVPTPSETVDLFEKLDPNIREVADIMKAVKLRSWDFPNEAAYYARSRREEDNNLLTVPRTSPEGLTQATSSIFDAPAVALLHFNHYSRSPFFPYPIRSFSEHVMLSSQTLEDLYNVLPCQIKEIPAEMLDSNGNIIGYDLDAPPPDKSVVMCIDDVLHGDTPASATVIKEYVNWKGPSYASDKGAPVIFKTGSNLSATRLSDLTLRLHQPYWLIHQGDCEHFVVFTQVHLPHPSDISEPLSYPLTTCLTPAARYSTPTCKICSMRAASFAISGDIRLGEPVATVCEACWKMLGPPGEDNGLIDDDDEDGEAERMNRGAGRERVLIVPLNVGLKTKGSKKDQDDDDDDDQSTEDEDGDDSD